MPSKEIEVGGRKVKAEEVTLPAGVMARDLATGKDTTGPAKIWRAVGAPAPGTQGAPQKAIPEEEEAEPEKPKRGRPPGEKKEGTKPPDL